MQQPSLSAWRIELANLITGVCAIGKDLIPVRKAFRHIKRPLVLLIQFNGDVLKIGRAFRTQIDNDVKNCAARTAHQLCFGRRRVLKMHTAHSSFLDVRGQVRLRDSWLQSVRGEFILAESARKKSAGVLPAFKVDNKGSSELGFREYHGTSLDWSNVGLLILATGI